MKLTHAEMISEVIKELREPFTTKEIVDAVVRRYSGIRPINRRSLGTDIAGCCANLRSHRHLPDLPVLLVSVGRGRYRRFDPRRDHLRQDWDFLRERTKESGIQHEIRNERIILNNETIIKMRFAEYLRRREILGFLLSLTGINTSVCAFIVGALTNDLALSPIVGFILWIILCYIGYHQEGDYVFKR